MNTSYKGTILIIEDEAGFRRIYGDVLTRARYAVLEAEDGRSGWKTAKAKKPDLILLDLVLPELYGFEVLEKIRTDETTREIPVIIFTVLGERRDVQKGFELGANDYVIKGFCSPREIVNKVNALLVRHDTEKHIGSYKYSVKEGTADVAKLHQDIDPTKLFQCPHCNTSMSLELIPDHTGTDGHRFIGHFVCPKCKRSF